MTDDTLALQACLNAAGNVFGSTVYLPNGKYHITSTLSVPDGVSLQGQGYGSIIYADGCDGLTLSISNIIGARYFRDFHIWGNNGTGHNAINIPGTVNTVDRVSGCLFQGLYISFFETGINLRSVWHSTLNRVVINNCWNAVKVHGQCIKILISDCDFQLGSGSGSGTATGIDVVITSDYNPGGNTPHRPEDVQIVNTIVYGFAIGINWEECLYGVISKCDIDAITNVGIQIFQQDGGLTVRDNWIGMTGVNATYGICCLDQAVAQFDRLLIDHNTIGTYDEANSSAIVSSQVKYRVFRHKVQSFSGNTFAVL